MRREKKQHSFVSHTPEEMRRLSNFAHIIEGVLLAIVGLLALLGNVNRFQWASTAWTLLILIAGIILLFLLYPLHPVSERGLIGRDAQQRQHTIIAIAIAGVQNSCFHPVHCSLTHGPRRLS